MILEKKQKKQKQKQTRRLQEATVWSCEPDVWTQRDADVLCLSKLSPKKTTQTRVQRALRHRARPNPGTHVVEVKTGSV